VDARHKAGHDEFRYKALFHWLHFESQDEANYWRVNSQKCVGGIDQTQKMARNPRHFSL
jgi:hypothetical protein